LRHLGRDGRAPLDLLRCDTEDLRERAREALHRRAPVRLGELKVRTPEGHELTVYQTFTPVEDLAGELVGLLITYRNVSDESRLQAHFRDLLNLEKQRAEALETAVEARTKDLMLALEQVTHLSRVDALTGVLNRRSFTEEAERAVRVAERSGRGVGLILLDLDHFKSVNDRHGHLAGDRVLKACAAAISKTLVHTDVVGRFGGEEFIAVVFDESVAAVERMAEQCGAAIRALPYDQIVPGAQGTLTVSAGVAVCPGDAKSLDELMLRADQALYTAKAAGRDCVQVYHPDLARAPSRMPEVARRALVLDATPANARGLVAGVGPSALCEVSSSPEQFRRRYTSEFFDVIIAAHQLEGVGFGEDVLHDSVAACPDALRILVIETEAQFSEVNVGLPNAIDLCLLRADVPVHLRHAIDDGLTRREVSRERLLTLSRRSLGGWSRHVRELRRFLDSGEIGFHFQPIVTLRDGGHRAHEMLCRPTHPLFANPLVLVDACLRSNLILEFGRLVRRAAVDTLRRSDLQGELFVNLHPVELTDPDFDRSIPDDLIVRMVFEINERASVLQVTDSQATLARLRSRGFRFAIDDLGAGYASLNAVSTIGAEFVKLDIEMVRGLSASTRKFNLVNRLIQFVNDEGIGVIAEGVETREDAESLRALGCHLGQGYFYGRPMPLAHVLSTAR
jgi:diguanylate cyclase (GGDEF)-like protein